MSHAALAAGVLAGTLSITLTTTAAGGALTAQESLRRAADSAALAAADTLYGFTSGEPCARAAQVSHAHRVELHECTLGATDVTVTVGRRLMGIGVEASARAGVPGERE